MQSPLTTANQVVSVKAEVECGCSICPLHGSMLPPVKISSIGLIPKPHQVGKWHLIVVLWNVLG